MARTKVLQSAAVIVNLNGRPFGVCTSFKWDSLTPQKEIYGIDQQDPFEVGTTITKINGTIGVYRTDGDNGAEGWGLTVDYPELSRGKYFRLLLLDRATDRVLFKADNCATSSQSWNIPAKGVITGTINFVALSWSNKIQSK